MKSKILSRKEAVPDDPKWVFSTGIDSVFKSWRCCCCSILPAFLLGLVLMLGITANAQSIRGIVPVQAPPGGSGVDGDAIANYSAVAIVPGPGVGDLFCSPSYPGTGGCVVDNNTGLPYDPTKTFVILDRYLDDLTVFASSNKINHNPDTYEWKAGSAPTKNEIQNAGAHFAYGDPAINSLINGVVGPPGDPDDLWCLFAGDRQDVNGSSYIDFEFLQEPLVMTVTGQDADGNDMGGFNSFASNLTGGRTVNDMLVTIEFQDGGDDAVISIRRWALVGSSYEWVIIPNTEFTTPAGSLFGAVFITQNTVETDVPYDVFGTQPGTYQVNQWAEGAVNLSRIFGEIAEDECFQISTLFIRTRTSGSSDSSELKDFPGAPIQLNLCIDSEDPVFTGELPPPTASYQCEAPAAPNLNYTDNCLDPGSVPGVDVSDGNTCPETITRTWTITDCGGNTATHTQIITINDDTPAVFDTEPDDASYQCLDDVPAPGNLGYTDNCDGAGSVLGVDVSDGNTCPEVITRTWSFTDACGNPSSVSQIITVDDTIAADFDPEPDDATYQCFDDVPAPGNLGYTDNCDGAGSVLGQDVSDGNTCPQVITRTWSFTDACGNPASVSQTITVEDTTDPVFDPEPDDASYQCIDDVPAPGLLGYTDNCDDPGSVLGQDVSDGNSCPETITRTWSFTDSCGNPASVSQIITVDDTIDPVFADEPDDASYQCIDDVPAPGNLGYTDNCDESGSVVGQDVSDGNSCPEVITRTWSFTDACGNSASVSQIITVDDTIAADFDDEPDDASYQCADDVPAPGLLGYTDNCDGAGSVLGQDVSDGNSCPETITRTWSFTDACGNPASVSQIITVDDTIAADFDDEPDDASYQCADDVPAPGLLGYTDNCDGAGSVLGQDVSDGNSCPETITRTWSFTDACGNPASVSQIITVDDTTAPVFADEPDDASYQCIDDVPAPGNLGYTDNCDAPGSVLGQDVSDGNTCPEIITRTWSFTDSCGNPASVSQIITVDDTIDPELSCPSNIISTSCEPAPVLTVPEATDNCDGDVAVVPSRSDGLALNDPFPIGETVTVTYTATDDCGNDASCSFTVLIEACGEPHCTYTQGYYGGYNGAACTPDGTPTYDHQIMVNAVTAAGGSVNFGTVGTGNYFTLKLTDINGDPNIAKNNIFRMLPGGGTARALRGFATYDDFSTWSDNDPLSNTSNRSRKGRINNVLLSQTMVLFFNKSVDSALGSYELQATFATADVECGSDVPDMGSVEVFSISPSIITYLDNTGDANVDALYDLANRILGGEVIAGITAANVNAAVDVINNAFDGCRLEVAVPADAVVNPTPVDDIAIESEAVAIFSAYPVPFRDYINIRYEFDYQSKVRIEVFDSKGMFLMSYDDADAYFNKEVKLNTTFNHGEGQMFFVKVITEREVSTKKVISKI